MKYLFLDSSWYTTACISYFYKESFFVGPYVTGYLAAWRCVFERIIDDILQNNANQGRICGTERNRLKILGQNKFFATNNLFLLLDDVLCEGDDIRLSSLERQCTQFYTRDIEELVDEINHDFIALINLLQILFLCLRELTSITIEKHFRIPTHSSERRTKLMRSNRDKFCLLSINDSLMCNIPVHSHHAQWLISSISLHDTKSSYIMN